MSIIIFNIILQLYEADPGTNPAGLIALQFVLLTFGSAAVGISIGMVNALLVKYQGHHAHAIRDVCMVFLFAYTAYEISEVRFFVIFR
jgi:NhaP-type Na+/H+ or K+/H+ antiporter